MAKEPMRAIWPRRLAHAAVIAVGVIAILGSGGGFVDFPEFDVSPAPIPPSPSVTVSPAHPTVQAGTIVRFTASVTNGNPPVSYKWLRDGVEIAGATESTYTLGGAQSGDDGATFQVLVAASNGVGNGVTVLRVSPLPPVVFQDTEFPLAGWSVTGIAQPESGGPTFTVAQASDGGNPGAHRRVAYQMTPAPSSLRLVHLSSSSVYEPQSQGEIYTVLLELDCSLTAATSLGNVTPRALPAFQQSGRTYAPAAWNSACGAWELRTSRSLVASDFTIAEGSACGPGERCPDFSATAAPLRFGVASRVTLNDTSIGGTLTQGLDNWKATVWKR